MATHHPALELLTEYAAGALAVAPAACIAAHLNYCADCRRSVERLQSVGGALFETQDPAAVGDGTLNKVLARLDEAPPLAYAAPTPAEESLPALLQRLMRGDFSDLRWRSIGDALRITYLPTGDPKREFALYRIRAGKAIPQHDHRGSEMTLVLEGGFSDDRGTYHAGDFVHRCGSERHAPRALPDGDCLCLAVLDAPLRFTGWKFRWINPFLRLHAH